MSKRSGFTLVELLVVIAIIALLIAILVPSLATARDVAKQMSCLSNLRNIGTGINIYGEVHKGWVPPFYAKDGEVVDVNPPRFMLAYVCEGGGVNDSVPVNLGHLHEQGIIEAPEIFYCAFRHHHEGFSSPDEYGEPWGDWLLNVEYAYPRSSYSIATGYSYNPHCSDRSKSTCPPRYRKVDQFPADAIVTMDALCSGGAKPVPGFKTGWVVHAINGLSFNVGYIDGHAENISWPHDVFLDRGLSSGAGVFEEVLDILESR